MSDEQNIKSEVSEEQILQPVKQKKSKKATIITVIILVLLFAVGAIAGALYAGKYKINKEQAEIAKYVEQSNVDSDVQLCDWIRMAMETAATDAAVANEPSYAPPCKGERGSVLTLSYGGTVYNSSFVETMGVNDPSEIKDYIKSTLGKKEGDIKYIWVSDSSVVVYIDNTDINGSTKKGHHLSSDNCQCIYAGPVELYE